MDRIKSFIDCAKFVGSFSFDIEHDPRCDRHKPGFEIVGCGFSCGEITLFETVLGNIFEICKELFPKIEAIAYNAKYDLQCLVARGLIKPHEYPVKLVDPMVAVNLLDDNLLPNKLGLKAVIAVKYDYKMRTFEEAWGKDDFLAYACDDASWEFKLWQDLKPQLELEGLLNLFEKILMPAVKVFADMEMVGMKFDLDNVRSLLTKYQRLRDSLEKDILSQIGSLNLNSGDQLAKRLFGELGYDTDGIEKTKKGFRYSVDSYAMNMLAKKYPVCKKIKTYRTAEKMINTYIIPLTKLASEDTNARIHPTYWLVSSTGRTRCSNPNLQNQPARLASEFKNLNIRNLFIAEKGRKLLVSDESQLELRLVAHITKDPSMLRAYNDWNCKVCNAHGSSAVILHSCPSCGIEENEKEGFWHGLDLHQITADKVAALEGDRNFAKQSNFSLVYCATARKMNYEYPAFSIQQWQAVIDDFFDVYPKVREWHIRMEKCLYGSRTCVDIFGRKRRILKQHLINNPKNALNMIVNFAPQSSGCGILELAMGKLREYWLDAGLWLNGIYPIGMIHDETIFEVEEELIEDACKILQEYMEQCVQLLVPLRVETKIVDKWGNAKS